MEKWLESVYSDGTINFISNPTPKLKEEIRIKMRFFKDSPIKEVFFRYITNGELISLPMKQLKEDDVFKYYYIDIKMKESKYNYRFVLVTDDEVYYYNQHSVTNYDPLEIYDFVIKADLQYPEWVKKSVFYHIFPDRFYSGEPENKLKGKIYEVDGQKSQYYEEWDSKPKPYRETSALDHFGGDLKGIEMKIPYLKSIGVNSIYLNPIFVAPSYHKYDCIDYYTVEPRFGGNEALISLSDTMHKNDMKLMLDISVNHTGVGHKWMNREMYFDKAEGAYHNKDSEYREFYYFDEDNSFYRWMGVDTLASLDYRSEKVKDVVYRNEDSVLKTYLKEPYNIDAWRLDVANNMAKNDEVQESEKIWPELRENLKSTKEDMYLIGEHWGDTKRYLDKSYWDAGMNYLGFSRPVRTFFNDNDTFLRRINVAKESKGNAKKLANQFMQMLSQNPTATNLVQFNAIDTHDVYRFHHSPGVAFSEVKGAVAMLFTFPGVPSVYYGDEVGIDGHREGDEGFRYPMVWDEKKVNKAYFELYSKLGNLRSSDEVLSDGCFKILYAEDGIISYARFNDNKAYILVASQELEARNLVIPSSIIGVNLNSKVSELLCNECEFTLNNGDIELTATGKETYLFEVRI